MLDGALWRSPPPISPNRSTPTNTAIVLTLSLSTKNVSGLVTLAQNLDTLNLSFWGRSLSHQQPSNHGSENHNSTAIAPDISWNLEL
jgi:alpha-galactosidase